MNNKTKYFSLFILVIIFILTVISILFFQKVGLQDVNKNKLENDTSYSPSLGDKNAKNTIVVFMDFKCPYCKKFEQKNFLYLNDKYIKKGIVRYKIINTSLLGKDSLIGARAAHAVNLYYPKKYWDFHKQIIRQQPNNENRWLTEKLIDRELNKINIPRGKNKEIKNDYKTKNSKSWKLANRDKKLFKKYNNKQVPSVYVNGRYINNPYNLKNIVKHFN